MNTRMNHLAGSDLFEVDDIDLETHVITPVPQ